MSEKCYCTESHAIVIDRRSASRVTSCLALGAFFVFAAGYFMGKRYAFQEDIDNQELALFSHRIQYALNEHGNQPAQDVCQEEQSTESDTLKDAQEPLPLITAQVVEKAPESVTGAKQYVALLAGYGTHKAAQQFVQRLEKKGIKAEIKTRVSTNAQKKSKKWYQVATQKYTQRQELESLTKLIRDLEHLTQDPKIIELT